MVINLLPYQDKEKPKLLPMSEHVAVGPGSAHRKTAEVSLFFTNLNHFSL